jgi:hypothetical protein
MTLQPDSRWYRGKSNYGRHQLMLMASQPGTQALLPLATVTLVHNALGQPSWRAKALGSGSTSLHSNPDSALAVLEALFGLAVQD